MNRQRELKCVWDVPFELWKHVEHVHWTGTASSYAMPTV